MTELLPLGYKDQNATPYTVATLRMGDKDLPSIGKTTAGQSLRLGGFSGLAFEGVTADGKLKFITNTDRGPNGEPNAAAQRPFLLPQFSPRLVRFTLDPAKGKFDLMQQIVLQRYAMAAPLTGLPNTLIAAATPNTPYNDEVPIDLFGKTLPLDPLGGDFEGIVVARRRLVLAAATNIARLSTTSSRNGRLIERFIPVGTHAAAGLPVPAPGAAGPLGIEALAGSDRAAPPEPRHGSDRDQGRQDLRVRAESDPQSGHARPTARSTPCATCASWSSIRRRARRGSSSTSWTIPCR